MQIHFVLQKALLQAGILGPDALLYLIHSKLAKCAENRVEQSKSGTAGNFELSLKMVETMEI